MHVSYFCMGTPQLPSYEKRDEQFTEMPVKSTFRCRKRTVAAMALTRLAVVSIFTAQALAYAPYLSSALNKRDAFPFPQIYIGQRLLDCGSPLIQDQCSFYPLNYSITTGAQYFSVSAPLLYSINATYSIVANNPTITIPIQGWLTLSGTYEFTITHTPPATRVAMVTDYTPSLGTGTVGPQVTSPPMLPRNMREVKRSYDYDVCGGQPPDRRLVTRSLVDVCHFVANAKSYFVSLRASTDAAYLPSWPGYLAQALFCAMYFFCIVSPFTMSSNARIKLSFKMRR